MSYDMERLAVEKTVAADIDDLSGTGVHTTSWLIAQKTTVRRLLAIVTTLLDGAATVVFKSRPVYGTAGGEVTLGTLVIPDTTVAGKTLYKDITPVNLDPGQELIVEVTVAATSGAAIYAHKSELHEEAAVEVTDMVKSA